MGQKRITIEVTEYQARVIRWSLQRADFVAPRSVRSRMFVQKLRESMEIVQEATVDLEDISPPRIPAPRIPKVWRR